MSRACCAFTAAGRCVYQSLQLLCEACWLFQLRKLPCTRCKLQVRSWQRLLAFMASQAPRLLPIYESHLMFSMAGLTLSTQGQSIYAKPYRYISCIWPLGLRPEYPNGRYTSTHATLDLKSKTVRVLVPLPHVWGLSGTESHGA